MADAEGDMARFILRDQQGDPARERIGRVTLEKPEQIQKRPFAQHRKQKRSEREIRLVQQRLERLPPAYRGQSQFSSAQRGAAREDFDMARLIRNLYGEQLQDFSKMRMNLGDEAGGYLQRRVFVFDQIGHHLDDGQIGRASWRERL